MIDNNQFFNQFFNQQCVTPNYYNQIYDQVHQYELNQTEEVANVVKAVHDLCKAYHKLDSEHQQQAFCLAVAKMAKELGW